MMLIISLLTIIACNTSSVTDKEIAEQLRQDSIASISADLACAEPPNCDSLQSAILQRPILKKGKEYMFQFFKDSLGHFCRHNYNGYGYLYTMDIWIKIDKKGNGLVQKTPNISHYSKNELKIYYSLLSFFGKNTKWLPLKLANASKGIDSDVSLHLRFEKNYITYSLVWIEREGSDHSCSGLDRDTIQIR